MSEVGDRDAVVRALIEREHRSEDDKPAVVGEMQDGRIRLDFVNNRPDSLDVYIKGRKRLAR